MTKLYFHFAVILASKKRYNNVNKRVTIFIFADYLSCYYESQALHLYAISALKISSYYLIKKKCFFLFCFVFFFWRKGFSAYMKNTFSLPSPSYAWSSRKYILSLNKPGTTSYGLSSLFSYVSAKLQNALPDFIRTYAFTGLKRESRDAFCTAAFLFNEYIFKYYERLTVNIKNTMTGAKFRISFSFILNTPMVNYFRKSCKKVWSLFCFYKKTEKLKTLFNAQFSPPGKREKSCIFGKLAHINATLSTFPSFAIMTIFYCLSYGVKIMYDLQFLVNVLSLLRYRPSRNKHQPQIWTYFLSP